MNWGCTKSEECRLIEYCSFNEQYLSLANIFLIIENSKKFNMRSNLTA